MLEIDYDDNDDDDYDDGDYDDDDDYDVNNDYDVFLHPKGSHTIFALGGRHHCFGSHSLMAAELEW